MTHFYVKFTIIAANRDQFLYFCKKEIAIPRYCRELLHIQTTVLFNGHSEQVSIFFKEIFFIDFKESALFFFQVSFAEITKR